MSFIVIPGIRVQGANIVSSQTVVGGPPVVAAVLFGHAMSLRARLGVKALGAAVIHHSITPLGDWTYGVFQPQQRRAAAFTFTNKADKDYSSKNKQALSLQPTASAHMRLSLLIETDTHTPVPDEIPRFLATARFAGGRVAGHGEIVHCDDIGQALYTIPTGYAVLDRRDLLAGGQGPGPAHAMVDALGAVPEEGGDSWLSATCVGYAAISDVRPRPGGRDFDLGYGHAFAEPLVGMVQFRSLQMLAGPFERLVWRPRWVREDVFVVQQSISL